MKWSMYSVVGNKYTQMCCSLIAIIVSVSVCTVSFIGDFTGVPAAVTRFERRLELLPEGYHVNELISVHHISSDAFKYCFHNVT